MAFLRQHHPFSELTEDRLETIRRGLEIIHVPAGQAILSEGSAPAEAIGLIRKGELELSTGSVVVDLLEAGDVFGLTSVMTGQAPAMTVRAVEDSLCYLVPADVARRVLVSAAAMASVWAIARQRVRAADAAARTVHDADPRFARIGSLAHRPPITIEPDATIAEAAARMRDERVSSLLIPQGDDWAIVTDRDLRTVVAERGSFDRPVGQIATHPVHVATADTLAGEAMLQMLELGIHHVPIADHGRLVGMLTDSDLMDLDRGSPFAIRSAIARAPSVNEVVFAARGLPAVVAGLVEGGGDPIEVGRVVSVIADAATTRLLALATEALGEAPCAYAWLALGSAARHERALHADQDHALALGPGFRVDEHDAYFAELAERVTAGLEAIGFPGATATRWRCTARCAGRSRTGPSGSARGSISPTPTR